MLLKLGRAGGGGCGFILRQWNKPIWWNTEVLRSRKGHGQMNGGEGGMRKFHAATHKEKKITRRKHWPERKEYD